MNEQTRETYWNPSMKTVSDKELKAFAHRLHQRMVELGLTQSELARQAFGTTVDGSGATQVKNRDKVSLYLRGKGLPGEDKMRSLAGVLKMSLKELAPPVSGVGETRPAPARPSVERAVSVDSVHGVKFEMTTKGMALLVCKQRMRAEDAARIAGLIVEAAKHASD